MPRPGNYRHKVTILGKTVTRDAIGGEVVTWSSQGSRWCSIEHQYKPNEAYNAVTTTQAVIEATWFKTRRTTAITTAMRLQHVNDVYEILSIDDEFGRNEETRLLCRRVIT